MRTRHIKPGILTNEDLAELGPYAFILFTGLWMMADREGRLEDRPRRIKAIAMPLWDECDAERVEKLLESLSEKQFIHRYEIAETRYIQITNWFKHQHPHPREEASAIPAPLSMNGASRAESATSEEATPRHVQGNAKDMPSPSLPSFPSLSSSGGSERKTTGSVQKSRPISPPPNGTRRKAPERKQPARADRACEGPREAPPKARAAPDWWPHKPEDVEVIRASLIALGQECRMPPPDDALIRRVLEVGRGHSGEEIHDLLRSLFQRGKFREMRSWGFIPLVVEQWCSHAA